MQATSSARYLRAGEPAPASGIYRAIHEKHRKPHDVSAIEGELLPYCRTCGSHVRFELLRAAELVTSDWDFAGPLLDLEMPPDKKVA